MWIATELIAAFRASGELNRSGLAARSKYFACRLQNRRKIKLAPSGVARFVSAEALGCSPKAAFTLHCMWDLVYLRSLKK